MQKVQHLHLEPTGDGDEQNGEGGGWSYQDFHSRIFGYWACLNFFILPN